MIVSDYPALNANIFYKHKHLSTILPALFRKHEVVYTRKRINTPDNDFFNVDCILRNHKKAVVLIHGLEGSSQSQYIKGMAHLFSTNQFDVHALNHRSCGGEQNLLLTSYHSGFTTDLTYYINQIAPKYEHIYLVGFSLGGNILLNYLSNPAQVSTKVSAAAAVSTPVDLKGSANELDNGFNRFYQQRFINSLIQKIRYKSKLFPNQLDTKGIHKIKTFKEFDDAYTAPIHGFKNAEDYWAKCSSLFVLNTITTPTLLINAKNDPFLSASCFPYDEVVDHPFVHAIFAPFGGHVGFMLNHKVNWLEPIVFSFFEE